MSTSSRGAGSVSHLWPVGSGQNLVERLRVALKAKEELSAGDRKRFNEEIKIYWQSLPKMDRRKSIRCVALICHDCDERLLSESAYEKHSAASGHRRFRFDLEDM